MVTVIREPSRFLFFFFFNPSNPLVLIACFIIREPRHYQFPISDAPEVVFNEFKYFVGKHANTSIPKSQDLNYE